MHSCPSHRCHQSSPSANLSETLRTPVQVINAICHQSSPPADLFQTPRTPVQVMNTISPLHQQTYPRLHVLLSKSSMPSVLSTSRLIRDSMHSCPSHQCHQSSPSANLSNTIHTPVQVINAISPLHQQTYPRLHALLSKSSMPSVLSTSRPIETPHTLDQVYDTKSLLEIPYIHAKQDILHLSTSTKTSLTLISWRGVYIILDRSAGGVDM